MKFSYFPSVKAANSGEILTPKKFWELSDSPSTMDIVRTIRTILNDESRTEEDKKTTIQGLKIKLPVICWQSSFPNGKRKDSEAVPSGLFMLDIDHTDAMRMRDVIQTAKALYDKLNIVYIGETPKYGVRIVAKCYPFCNNIAECQTHLYNQLNIPEEQRDPACVDWARCSFVVPSTLHHFVDTKAIFEDEPLVTYENKVGEKNATLESTPRTKTQQKQTTAKYVDNGQEEYQGVLLAAIAKEWLECNGGEPVEGDRNTKLFRLCTRMRFICDFNELVMLRVIPRYGLDEEEMKVIIHNANAFVRSMDMPSDLKLVVERLVKKKNIGGTFDEDDEFEEQNDTSKTPPLPPIFKEWYDSAPLDFKLPSVIIQLPILGALGSRLRAEYLDGQLHSPSFQVSLEAPQASGKSFMRKIIDCDLALMKEHDAAEREKEREYNEKVAQLKLTNTKLSKKDKEEMLGEKPNPIIRYCPATMSITQLLRRMHNAQGLHIFATCEEIDTVYKSFKRGFSSFSDALRCAFDNAEYGQDFASESSFSGIVKLYYNVLYSGTPKAMRRFYPDVEDGLVSRVFFCTLPDQFGKAHPVWKKFTEEQQHSINLSLTKLNEMTLQGETVQPVHVMEMDWLSVAMEAWVINQQQLAVQADDRTRDIFCRRAAVVGFRAGMLAWFLWNEIPQRKKSVIKFATWIANLMLKQHLSRFNIEDNVKNTLPFAELFESLPNEFVKDDLVKAIAEIKPTARDRQVIYKWSSLGLIKKDKKNGVKTFIKVEQ